jgi:hypothetical protein
MSNFNRGPSIDASYQVSVHLAMWFQRRRFLEIDQSETRIACGGHEHLWKVLYRDCSFRPDPLTNMTTTGDSCFWLADFKNSSPLKLLSQMIRNLVGSIYGWSSIKSTHFVPIPLTTVWEEKIFRNRPIRNKNCLWWPCLLMDRDRMSIIYRGPSIDASY